MSRVRKINDRNNKHGEGVGVRLVKYLCVRSESLALERYKDKSPFWTWARI